MSAQQARVLRVGVIRNGKIVEERVLPARQSVTIGSGPGNTIVAAGSTLPPSLPLFLWHGDRWLLSFREGVLGRIQGPQGEADLSALVAQGLAARQGSGFQVHVHEDQRGKLVLGDVTVLWQFVAAAPAAPRPAVPSVRKGSHFQSMDRMFVWILLFSFLFHTGFYAVLAATDLPQREVTLEEIPDRYAKVLIPERKAEPPKLPEKGPDLSTEAKAEPPREEAGEEGRRAGAGGQGGARGRGRQGGPVEGHPQGAGRARPGHRPRRGGRRVRLRAAGWATWPPRWRARAAWRWPPTPAPVGGRKGGGQGGAASIGSLATAGGGGGKVGYGAKAEVKVSGSVAAEAAEVDSSEVDQGKLGAFVRARMRPGQGLLRERAQAQPVAQGQACASGSPSSRPVASPICPWWRTAWAPRTWPAASPTPCAPGGSPSAPPAR